MAVNIEFAKYLESLRTWEKAEESRSKVFADSRWAWRFEEAQRRARYERLAEPLARALDSAVSKLTSALNKFEWPDSELPLDFRRSTDSDPGLDGKLSGRTADAQDAQRFYKFFSRGRDADSGSGIDAGTYRFEVELGGETEKIELEVGSSDTWGDVLENVAGAVNDLKIPVQAEVIVQHNAYQKIDGLGKTGAILAFSVEPGRDAQDLKIKDTYGLLVNKLDLEETSSPVLPADTRTYSLSATSDAEPTAIYSQGLDYQADTGLESGLYKLAYSIGGESGTFDVEVDSDMTWGEMLEETANVINSTTDKVRARVVDVNIFSGLDDPLHAEGKSLEIMAADPKLGERLSLSGYGGPWLDPVDEFFDPSGNLPAAPIEGDRYVAMSTANGWTEDRIYEWNGSAWDETAPVAGNALYAGDEGANYFYDGTSWSTTATGEFHDTLELRRPSPGMDAELLVDNRAFESATGTFSRDRGRLIMDLEDSFGERLPLKVLKGMEKLSQGLSDAVSAYNGLQEFLEPNRDLFREDFTEDWRDTVRENRTALSWLGVTEIGDEGTLMTDMDKFFSAVSSDPERARELLLGEEDGLLTAWSELADKARSPDAAGSLIPKAYLQDVSAPASRAFENEKRSALQQVIDSELETDSPNRTTEMELEILKASAEETSEVDRLMGDAGLNLTGSIFKRRG